MMLLTWLGILQTHDGSSNKNKIRMMCVARWIWGLTTPLYWWMGGNKHYIDVTMTTMASKITSLTVVYSIVYSDADQRKHQSSASLAFVWGIHRDRWIPRTKASYAENVSIWWRHHECSICIWNIDVFLFALFFLGWHSFTIRDTYVSIYFGVSSQISAFIH